MSKRRRQALAESMGDERMCAWEPVSFGDQADKIPGALKYIAAVRLMYSYGYKIARMVSTPSVNGSEYIADVLDRTTGEPRGRRALSLDTRRIRTVVTETPRIAEAA